MLAALSCDFVHTSRQPQRGGIVPRWRVGLVSSITFVLASLLFAELTPPATAEPIEGEWIIVRSPITSETFQQVRNQTEEAISKRQARVIVYQFLPGDLSEFGPCSDLADFIFGRIEARAATYAFIDKPLRGHAVLPALACRSLFMGPDAAIGFDEDALTRAGNVDESKLNKYMEIADGRGKPKALVRKMLDKSLEVYLVQSIVGGKQYKLKGELTPEDHNTQPRVILNAGEAGLYETKKAVEFGLCGREYVTAQEVAEALNLPGSIIHGDPLEGQPPRVAWIEIKGNIDGRTRGTIIRKIKRAINKEGVNCLVFEIQSTGGDVNDADHLAKEIQDLGRGEHPDYKGKRAKTIAYIPGAANGAATFIVFACHEIVLGHQGEFGDCGGLVYTNPTNRRAREPRPPDDVKQDLERLMMLAQEQGHSPVLVRGLMDLSLVIVPVEAKADPNAGGVPAAKRQRFMDKEEAEKQADRWSIIGPPIKEAGKLLKFNARNAPRLGVVRHVAESWEGLASHYGIDPNRIIRLPAEWLDMLVEFLTHWFTTMLLVVVGFTCLLLEFKAPGLGLPAILSALCFLLLFWAHTRLSGELNALAILLFLLGLLLLGVEIFITPGFGVVGISGVVILLLGLALAVTNEWPDSQSGWERLGRQVGYFAGALIVSLVAAYTVARYLPSIPYANRLVLQPPDDETSDAGASLPPAQSPALLGAVGVAVTTLRPAGKARFGDELIDVVAEGTYLEAGTRIQVIEIDGMRVIVKGV